MRGGQRIGSGRPPDAEPRNELVQIRVTKAEKDRIKATADHYGIDVSNLVRAALGLAALVLVLLGCDTPAPDLYRACDTAADCTVGEVCPVETGICAPTCVDYDDCYAIGDGHCAYLAEGPACVWHCAEDAPDDLTCEGLEDEGSVLVSRHTRP